MLPVVTVSAADVARPFFAEDSKNFLSDNIILNSTITSKSNEWVLYKQCDSQWANEKLGTCATQTICSAGCAMSSVAMILATRNESKSQFYLCPLWTSLNS